MNTIYFNVRSRFGYAVEVYASAEAYRDGAAPLVPHTGPTSTGTAAQIDAAYRAVAAAVGEDRICLRLYRRGVLQSSGWNARSDVRAILERGAAQRETRREVRAWRARQAAQASN